MMLFLPTILLLGCSSNLPQTQVSCPQLPKTKLKLTPSPSQTYSKIASQNIEQWQEKLTLSDQLKKGVWGCITLQLTVIQITMVNKKGSRTPLFTQVYSILHQSIINSRINLVFILISQFFNVRFFSFFVSIESFQFSIEIT